MFCTDIVLLRLLCLQSDHPGPGTVHNYLRVFYPDLSVCFMFAQVHPPPPSTGPVQWNGPPPSPVSTDGRLIKTLMIHSHLLRKNTFIGVKLSTFCRAWIPPTHHRILFILLPIQLWCPPTSIHSGTVRLRASTPLVLQLQWYVWILEGWKREILEV